MFEERAQKALAKLGFGSRREIERWIEQGAVKVNGKKIELGAKLVEGDRVQLNNRSVIINSKQDQTRVILYNKPEGEICTRNDPEGRKSVFKNLPKIKSGRWINIGRLDINTSGLLLFTNNGELANRMMHPSYEIEREYAVRVNGHVSNDVLEKLQKNVELEDGNAHFESIEDGGGQGKNHWYHVVLKEGRNREVRRLWDAVDCQVSRLIRIRYGIFTLPRNLRQRNTVEFDYKVVQQMADDVNLTIEGPKPVSAAKRHYQSKGGKRK